jgi:hypothetical protein
MKNLFKSLAAFQQAAPVIHKGTEGYGYSYADLPTIFEAINPLLKEHGLGFTQLLEGESIKTIIFHSESGESLESSMTIPNNVQLKGMNYFQVMGSAITYYRRYALSSALGLVTDKDTDAAGEQVKQDKPWLNPNTEAWTKVVKAMKDGYKIDQVKKKYAISKDNQKKLQDEAL